MAAGGGLVARGRRRDDSSDLVSGSGSGSDSDLGSYSSESGARSPPPAQTLAPAAAHPARSPPVFTNTSRLSSGIGSGKASLQTYRAVVVAAPMFVLFAGLLVWYAVLGGLGGVLVWALGGCCDRSGNETGSMRTSMIFSYTSMVGLGFGGGSEPSSIAVVSVAIALRALFVVSSLLAGAVAVAKLTRATSRVVFGKHVFIHAVRGKYRPHNVVSVRVGLAVPGAGPLVDATAEMVLELPGTDGVPSVHVLKLANGKNANFTGPWTLVHAIDGNSPLRSLSRADIVALLPRLSVVVSGFDPLVAGRVSAASSFPLWDVADPASASSAPDDVLQWARHPAPLVISPVFGPQAEPAHVNLALFDAHISAPTEEPPREATEPAKLAPVSIRRRR
ncbi:uncharacterized protein AMSG_04655 [Thecamonas trahens ATCC 50062]|uniref:Inward rectifier potassium channel C-terminal domain-containing protein n=1 Tax=Thecamonas trahens ATCC 50062 TaxID=461836 RepID=A0A0L0D9J2_THETB|nr:hypothetical protein AMSG_04655 [Thecamonas trahens ATCC 50062]KNC48910.1 hypothetical protein AMSG_04655 [Thecamonas trahens ATCC 50062]|eukprot:XP_013758327.1 hypothetical protein AMSG_04655 [Thecamonas trahens ATCC 50062]